MNDNIASFCGFVFCIGYGFTIYLYEETQVDYVLSILLLSGGVATILALFYLNHKIQKLKNIIKLDSIFRNRLMDSIAELRKELKEFKSGK